jgi:tagaturonate epimerase
MNVKLNRFSFGVGDRFAHQAKAQLTAIQKAKESGVSITPVWNKSYREHTTIGSKSNVTRRQADLAVTSCGWNDLYFLDADHINLSNVDFFMETCDFFTLDVADYIGQIAGSTEVDKFVSKYSKYIGTLDLPGLNQSFDISEELIKNVAGKYLFATHQAGEIYRHIITKKEANSVIIEVSMDETDAPQTPVELFFILAALSDEEVPLQTIAPKFSGRFNKGVDYVGDLERFKTEFEQDVAVINLAISEFSLPGNLKLSVHSGSDKFSLYPIIKETVYKYDAGLHLKTAGTTWLEELIGLAEAGGDALALAKEIYRESLDHYDELCAPYATVIDIHKNLLPSAQEVDGWDGKTYASTLRHDPSNAHYNQNFRQLLHVGYKIAAKKGEVYLNALEENEDIIAKNVTENIFDRHIQPLFL